MKQPIAVENIVIDTITHTIQEHHSINADVLRLDKIHPIISGNKWFKLKEYVVDAIDQNKKGIITFGGAWSNHIVATAALCQLKGLPSIGIIRGEQPKVLSSSLTKAIAYGMELRFISRDNYHEKIMPSDLSTNEFYTINEGGFGTLGAKGAASILHYANRKK